MEAEKTFLQVLDELPDSSAQVVRIDSDFIANFCTDLCSNASIKGVMKIEDVENKFESALDMIDELMKVENIYRILNSLLATVKSNMEVDYFNVMLKSQISGSENEQN